MRLNTLRWANKWRTVMWQRFHVTTQTNTGFDTGEGHEVIYFTFLYDVNAFQQSQIRTCSRFLGNRSLIKYPWPHHTFYTRCKVICFPMIEVFIFLQISIHLPNCFPYKHNPTTKILDITLVSWIIFSSPLSQGCSSSLCFLSYW